MTAKIGFNEYGKRCGETHHRAKLTDDDVEQIIWLFTSGLNFSEIARKWDDGVTISKSTVRDICRGRRRVTWPVVWRDATDTVRGTT